MELKLNNVSPPPHEWFTGNYTSWEHALADCNGYHAPNILQKVRDSLLKVKNGAAVYERDSVLFDHIEYSMPLLAGLLYAAICCGNKLSVLDFGGSLGSSYFQNRHFLDKLNFLRWSIVEQQHFFECGKQYFEDDILKFYPNMEECFARENPDLILASGVLPYLKEPYYYLQKIIAAQPRFIIIDRTPFFTDLSVAERLTLEHVPADIYDAKYPAWFFNETKFLACFKENYALKESFPAIDILTLKGFDVKYKVFLFEHKNK